MTKKIRLQAPFGDLGCQRPVDADPFTEEKIPFIMASDEEILGKYSIPSAFGAYLKRI